MRVFDKVVAKVLRFMITQVTIQIAVIYGAET